MYFKFLYCYRVCHCNEAQPYLSLVVCAHTFVLCFYISAPPELISITVTDVTVTVLQDDQLVIEAPYPVS